MVFGPWSCGTCPHGLVGLWPFPSLPLPSLGNDTYLHMCMRAVPGRAAQMWLCLPCGEKYKSRNYCPTCGVTFEELDNTVQAVGCSACEFWVHAKCEGLSPVRVCLRVVHPSGCGDDPCAALSPAGAHSSRRAMRFCLFDLCVWSQRSAAAIVVPPMNKLRVHFGGRLMSYACFHHRYVDAPSPAQMVLPCCSRFTSCVLHASTVSTVGLLIPALESVFCMIKH